MTLQTAIRVPALSGGPAPDRGIDYSSQGGAELLAERIRRIWQLLGYVVTVWVEPVVGTSGIGGSATQAWAVRSNMVGGLPRDTRTVLH